MANGRIKPCKWCGGERRGGTRSWSLSRNYRCINPECPRKSQVPWRVPVMAPLGRLDSLAYHGDEENPGFEDIVRVLEDFPSLTE